MNREVKDALVAAMRRVDSDELRLVTAVYRHLLRGRPADVAAVASDAGWEPDAAEDRLATLPAVFWNADGEIVGFWGLSSEPMSIRVESAAGWASLWCALDPLFILPLLETAGTVTARCPTTGATITVRVTPNAVEAVEPVDPAMSLLMLEDGLSDNVQDVFCHSVLFFVDREAAETWTAEHPGTFVVSLAEAADLGRAIADRMRGAPTIGNGAR